MQAPGAGWGRKWILFWQPWSSTGSSFPCPGADPTLHEGKGQCRARPVCSVLLRILSGSFPPGAAGSACSSVTQILLKGRKQTLLSLKQLSGHLYLVIPAPPARLCAAVRIPVLAEVEAEHFWAGPMSEKVPELSLPAHTGTRCLLSPLNPLPFTHCLNPSYSVF